MAYVIVHHQYILTFQITVDDAVAVKIVDGKCYLANNDQSIKVGEDPALFSNKGKEVATWRKIEEEEQRVLRLECLLKSDNVWLQLSAKIFHVMSIYLRGLTTGAG